MTYEYKCKDCKKKWVVSVSLENSLNMVQSCPDCKSQNVGKVFSSVPFILTGNGWYSKDKDKK